MSAGMQASATCGWISESLIAQSKLDALKRDSEIKPLKEKEAMDTQPSSSHDNLKPCQSQDLVLRRTEKNEPASAAEWKRPSIGHWS